MEPTAWDDAKALLAKGAKRVFGLALIGGPGLFVLFLMWRVSTGGSGGSDPRAGVVRLVLFLFLLLLMTASFLWLQWTLTWVPKRYLGVDYWNE